MRERYDTKLEAEERAWELSQELGPRLLRWQVRWIGVGWYLIYWVRVN